MIGDDREKFSTFAVSPDGKLLAGGSSGFGDRDRVIRLWDVATGKRLDELKPRRTSSDGRVTSSGSRSAPTAGRSTR